MDIPKQLEVQQVLPEVTQSMLNGVLVVREGTDPGPEHEVCKNSYVEWIRQKTSEAHAEQEDPPIARNTCGQPWREAAVLWSKHVKTLPVVEVSVLSFK